MDNTTVLNTADKRKKAADAVCLVFDMLVLSFVVWAALPALDTYTSAGIIRPGAVTETERLLEADAVTEEDSVFNSGYPCEVCGKDPGHVAIYIGDGKVAGSQPTYILTLDEFREYFGFGGWSFGGS